MRRTNRLELEPLERRDAASASAIVNGTNLEVTGSAGRDRIDISQDGTQIVVRAEGVEVGRFSGINLVKVDTGAGDDRVRVARDLLVPVQADGGDGRDKFLGGAAPSEFAGGTDTDLYKVSAGPTSIHQGPGNDLIVGLKPGDLIDVAPEVRVVPKGNFAPGVAAAAAVEQTMTVEDVQCLLQVASAASDSEDAIIAIVDRNGRILGVRTEANVDANLLADPNLKAFAIDGAIAKARTAAFFANNAAPLTSRTVGFISQSTITQREVESLPFDMDPNSIGRGPGYVAPVRSGGHFPPGVPNTPQVDLFAIEHTNRDSEVHPGADHIKGTADDIPLAERFNIDTNFRAPGVDLFAPESYGAAFGQKNAQSRGIATLPGGIPLYKNGQLVGGIGVFFPGKTGFATEENSILSTTYNPAKPDRTIEAEYMAFVAAGGAPGIGKNAPNVGVPACPGFALPLTPDNQRIDLVGITLDIIGPGGQNGPTNLLKYGQSVKPGNPFSGTDQPVAPGKMYEASKPVPEGWLVEPHSGVGITEAQVRQLIEQGIAQADKTRAAIRLPLDSRTKMVFAVSDLDGNIVGLYRMPDATVFSIDVAVAKARNVAYYASATAIQPIDQVPGIPAGTALTSRTFRYLAEPRFPEGVDGAAPGPFSIYNDGGSNPLTGLLVGPRLPASAFQSALGFDSFNPGTNFHDTRNIANQNGVVFFPGSAPVYANNQLAGGLGVSGDGVDQDDVVTAFAANGFKVPAGVLQADLVFVRGVRLPYQKFNRNPEN
ncbi:MAG: heme-binding protein [Gemmataceae bacterium]|nr:heme-binding protein [Gemmataceae bacterium]